MRLNASVVEVLENVVRVRGLQLAYRKAAICGDRNVHPSVKLLTKGGQFPPFLDQPFLNPS